MEEQAHLQDLFVGALSLSGWEQYSGRDNFVYCGVAIPGLRQEAYKKEIEGALVSVGVFYYNNQPAYIAWGLMSAVHCGFHALLSPQSVVLETRISCPDVLPTKNTEGVINGFTLDEKVFN